MNTNKKAMLIKADDTVEVIEYTDDDGFEKFSDAVGGLLQLLPTLSFDLNACMYCNENGKYHNLPLNKLATFLSGFFPHDVIVGNVVIVGAPDSQGYESTVPDEVIEAVQNIDIEATWDNLVNVMRPSFSER